MLERQHSFGFLHGRVPDFPVDARRLLTIKKARPWFGHILITPDYKPGDLPPEGYLQWHAWAEVQRKAKIKQVECPTCGLWRTPQELSTREVRWEAQTDRGKKVELSAFQCAKCFEKEAADVAS